MKCKNCNARHLVLKKRWTREGWIEYNVHECWGVPEPFEITDINRECTEYPEKRETTAKCSVCEGDYNQQIHSYLYRYHTSNEFTSEKIDTHYCPKCGRKLTE